MATEPFSERHDDDPPTPRPTPRPMQGGALDTLEDPAERPAPPSPWFWRHVGVVQAVCALGLAVVLLLPMLPASASDRIWDFPPLSFELRQPPLTIVNALLVLVLVWWYVVAAVRAASDTPDPLVRYVGERAILLAALASVVVVVLGVRNTFLYPFFSLVAIHTGVGLPSHEVYEAQTLLLVLAIAVASLTLNRAAAWRRAPLPERRASAVHNAVTLLAVLLGAWAIVACYLPLLEAIHEFLGSLLYNLFGQRGNLAGAILMILLSAALAYLAIRLLRPLAGRVEAFFVDRAVP